MDSHGRLGRHQLTVAETEYAPGDRIICLRNDDALGVKNGTRATVEAVDRRHRTLKVVTDRGDRVELGGRYLEDGHVRHAYTLTGHAGQGVTVERAFVLGIGGQRLQEWGYVALSRARHESRLYVTATPRERESHFHDLDDRDPVTASDRHSRNPRLHGSPSTSARSPRVPSMTRVRRSSELIWTPLYEDGSGSSSTSGSR